MSRRGVVLVAVLLILALLVIFGLVMLSKESAHFEAARRDAFSAQAFELAMAGLEDARVKLDKDYHFPRSNGSEQVLLSYSEVVYDLDEVTELGSYRVTIDQRWQNENYQVLRITSVGYAGPASQIKANRRLVVYLDTAAELRGAPGTPNPNYFEFINFEDRGSL